MYFDFRGTPAAKLRPEIATLGWSGLDNEILKKGQ